MPNLNREKVKQKLENKAPRKAITRQIKQSSQGYLVNVLVSVPLYLYLSLTFILFFYPDNSPTCDEKLRSKVKFEVTQNTVLTV